MYLYFDSSASGCKRASCERRSVQGATQQAVVLGDGTFEGFTLFILLLNIPAQLI
jgi:hypothetical protein